MSEPSHRTDPFVAIADATRRRILELLEDRDLAVNDLARQFHISRPAISQHLGVLQRAGLVSVTVAGRERRYRAEPASLSPVVSWVRRWEDTSRGSTTDVVPESQADGA